jgi:hypothetical protein
MRFRKTLTRMMLVTAVGLALPLATLSQSVGLLDEYGRWVNGISEPWMFPESIPKQDIAVAQRRWLAIEAGTKTSSEAEWEGNYFIGGDTHGSYLRWSQREGFVLMNIDKCAAQVMGFSYGRVVFAPGLIQLVPERAITGRPNHSHATKPIFRFLPVTWRGNRYLVPENQIADFGDYVAGLGKYNDWAGNYIERVEFFAKFEREVVAIVDGPAHPSSAKKRAFQIDLPKVPPGFERFMKQPIDVAVVRVGLTRVKHSIENEWWDDLVIPLTLSAGRLDRVRRKMKFRMADSDEVIIVTNVGIRSSQAILVRNTRKKPCVKFSKDDDCGDWEYPPIVVGLRASTSAFR